MRGLEQRLWYHRIMLNMLMMLMMLIRITVTKYQRMITIGYKKHVHLKHGLVGVSVCVCSCLHELTYKVFSQYCSRFLHIHALLLQLREIQCHLLHSFFGWKLNSCMGSFAKDPEAPSDSPWLVTYWQFPQLCVFYTLHLPYLEGGWWPTTILFKYLCIYIYDIQWCIN